MQDLLIQNIGQIVSPKPGVIRGPETKTANIFENGAVYIKEGVIQAVGELTSVLKKVEGHPEILDAEYRSMVPGFVDSHTHLVFGGNRADEFGMRSAGMSYEEIANQGGGILSTVKATREASKLELIEKGLELLHKALKNGTTTIEIKSGYGLNRESELKILSAIEELKTLQPIEIKSTFLGAHAVPEGSTKNEYLNLLQSMMEEVSVYADFCDVFCEKGYFDAAESALILKMGKEAGMIPTMHVNQFNDIGGINEALKIGCISVDHLEVLSEEDSKALAASDTVCTALPGVSYFLNIPYTPARKLLDSGAVVALATDFNPGSSMTISLPMIMSLACTKMGMHVNEALNGITQNGAKALGLEKVGCIAPGYQGDLLLLNTRNYIDLAYFFGENHIDTVVKKGKVVWRSPI